VGERTRDPNSKERLAEIDAAVEAVREALYASPGLRMGQLLWRAAGGDPFYLEDDDLTAVLRARVRQSDSGGRA
jgi:hypothetical protein